jgi:outer membrane protein TolC
VAAARLDIAEGTVGQAREAHRIVSRKYDGGLATVAELLDAATAETAAHLGVVAARYEAIMATTEILRAEGSELSLLGDLED